MCITITVLIPLTGHMVKTCIDDFIPTLPFHLHLTHLWFHASWSIWTIRSLVFIGLLYFSIKFLAQYKGLLLKRGPRWPTFQKCSLLMPTLWWKLNFSLGVRIKCHNQQTDFLFTYWFTGIHFQEAASISRRQPPFPGGSLHFQFNRTITVCPGRNPLLLVKKIPWAAESRLLGMETKALLGDPLG